MNIADHLPTPVVYCDRDLVYRYVNPVAAAWHGRPREDIVGRHVSEIIPAAQLRILTPRHDAVLAGNHMTFDARRTFADGVTRILQSEYVPKVDDAGAVVGFFVLLHDETARFEAIEEARRAQHRLEVLRQDAGDALVLYGPDGNILSFNRAAETIYGYAADEVIGRSMKILMADREARMFDINLARRLRRDDDALIDGEFHEVNNRRKDGSIFPAELRLSRIEHDDETLFNCVVRDITERKTLATELDRQMAALARSNQDLEDFSYIASHDLREPLRGIGNNAQFLLDDFGEALGTAGRERISRMQKLCRRADALITGLLDFSRLARADLALESVDLDAVVGEVLESLADFLEERGATVRVLRPLPRLPGDPARLASVFRNLIANGVRYNDGDRKVIEIGTGDSAGAATRDGDPVLFVRDDGIGIAPEHAEKVFTIFRRLNSEEAYGPGTGAGLSFVKKIVERHHGRIWLESAPGRGSTFYFTLKGPVSRATGDAIAARRTA